MKILGFAAAMLLMSSAAFAQDAASTGVAGHFQARLRGAVVSPDASANITAGGVSIGGTTSASDSFIPEADLTYFVTDHIGVEAIAGITKHTVRNSVAGTVGNVWLLPPTVTAQWHFDPTGPIRPYVGAGINYTFFYDAKSALGHLGFKNSFGWALQAGVDVPVKDTPYFFNLDVKKIFLNTRGTITPGTISAAASIDPWIIGTGVGIRF